MRGLESNGGWSMSEATHAQSKEAHFCRYCGGRLNLGYHFTCHYCGETYCYIHLSKHARAHAPRMLPIQASAR
jgi:tRNA(Ile2) C34 agmatinyltransferase TiaS